MAPAKCSKGALTIRARELMTGLPTLAPDVKSYSDSTSRSLHWYRTRRYLNASPSFCYVLRSW